MDPRRFPIPEPRFPSEQALFQHFAPFLPLERMQGIATSEKALFIIRRESSLDETRRQWLLRLDAVLQAEADGLPHPDSEAYVYDIGDFQTGYRFR